MRVHLMGICGTAMASLAGLLKSLGHEVSGSDQNVYPPMSTQLRELGIPIQEGYRKENLALGTDRQPELVIVGNVISRGNPEVEALLTSSIPYTSLPKALGEYAIADRHSIVIAGTHGKTTTTSIMIKVADACGIEPGFMVGGIPTDYGRSFRVAERDHFIIEGDEYDTAFFDKVPKFIHYKPRSVILTSVEFDHADIYKDLAAVKNAFHMLMERIPSDGLLVARADDKNVMEVARAAKCPVVTFSTGQRGAQADYQIVEREIFNGRNQFAVQYKGKKIADIAIRLPGEHNALNAIAVFALAHQLGWKVPSILQGLADFKGVKRRQEIIGTPSGITLIEDFAHHPTAVAATIDAIRERYLVNEDGESKGRLIALFEPRSATSRRRIFQREYVEAFRGADMIFVAKAYDQSKIAESERFSSAELVRDLLQERLAACEFENVDDIVDEVKKDARQGDVVLVMSNGGFGGIYQKLNKKLGDQS